MDATGGPREEIIPQLQYEPSLAQLEAIAWTEMEGRDTEDNPLRSSALPGDQHCGVVVGDAVLWDSVPIAVPVHNGFLPLAEAVQGFPGVVVNLQGGLK